MLSFFIFDNDSADWATCYAYKCGLQDGFETGDAFHMGYIVCNSCHDGCTLYPQVLSNFKFFCYPPGTLLHIVGPL